MTLPFAVNGARTVIPGVYDSFRVQDSLPAPVPAGRSVLILGESNKGIPGQELDLRLNFFTDFQSVASFYGEGPIVDAARMTFASQPSPVFVGAVRRLYIWKTNQTTRAEKSISGPSGFGDIVAAEYGEEGNFIQSQVRETTESLATKSFQYLPSPAARSFAVSLNGAVTGSLALGALNLATDAGTPVQFVTQLDSVSGLNATGGAAKTHIVGPNTVDVSFAADGDQLTITKSGGAGDFGANGTAGDVVVIPEGSALAGASDQNAGAYIVVSWSLNQIIIKQMKRYASAAESNAVAFDLTAASAVEDSDLGLFSPVTLTQTQSAGSGIGSTLELLGASGATFAAGNMARDQDFANMLTTGAAAVGSVSATVPASGRLNVSLSGASWSVLLKAGDVVKISRNSSLAGSGLENVGMHVVLGSTGNTLNLQSAYGLGTIAVAATELEGELNPVQQYQGFVSTDVAGIKLSSSQERQVWVVANRTSDGEQFPTTKVGGSSVLEVSYNLGGATAATLTINQKRQLIIEPTGAGSTITVPLLKYRTLQMLATFLNAQDGVSARIPDNRHRSLSPSVLDMVDEMGILGGHSTSAYNGKIKKDYHDWVQLFADNFGLLAFREGTLLLKSGLPDAEANTGFLSGAVVGATSDADIQKGLDQALKVDARMVVPLFSRDAQYDQEDGLTDSGSSYSISSINAATASHAATASGKDWRRERFGMLSFHGSFSNALQASSEVSYERTQMTFQQFRATGNDGLQWFAPWMGAVAISAGRAQAPLGTSMLRKTFAVNAVRHTGNTSLFSDTLSQDFDPEDNGMLSAAIEAGLMTFRAVDGVGVRLESPDLSTRSRENDPQGWVYERVNVLFTCDEVRQTLRTTLENFIGNRQSDTPLSVVRTAANDVIGAFLGDSLIGGQVLGVKRVGTAYEADVEITPTEALEAIVLNVLATRAPQGAE